MAEMRYIVHDVDAAVAFHTAGLGFDLVDHTALPWRSSRAAI